MELHYRRAEPEDPGALKNLGINAWAVYESELSSENWQQLFSSLNDEQTYKKLLTQSTGFVCSNKENDLVGMAFLVPPGNPTDIYSCDWSYIRLVSVMPGFEGKGIGRELTLQCILHARSEGYGTIALHTSEMMHKARHIYEQLRFQIDRELPRRFGKRFWLYKRSLS